jgi:hypothetical protein
MAADFKPCSIDGCNGNAGAKGTSRGWCSAHYHRWQRHGDPLSGSTPRGTSSKSPSRFLRENIPNHESDECLTWPYTNDPNGYGQIRISGKLYRVSRLVCEDVHGPAPTPEHHAAHSCGKGHEGCVNRAHLSWKTASANQMDRVEHDTSNRGERNHFDKLTAEDVMTIRKLHNIVEQHELAFRFDVSRSTIQDIQYRNSWQWLD